MTKTYFIQTFGCQMNQSDSERMAAYLDGLGFKPAGDWESADYVVLNTCSVKQKAEDRINGVVNNIREKDLSKQIILTGCMTRRVWDDTKKIQNSSQRSSDEREIELKKSFPKVDIIIETKDFPLIGEKLGFKKVFNDAPEHYLSFKPKYKSKFQAYVPISTGCNHFCTFCIVPFSRGKEVCRPANEIIREVFDLVKNGYKDITLLGQTVNRWINPAFRNEFDYNEALTYIEGLNTRPMSDKSLEIWKSFFTKKINDDPGVELEFENNLDEPKDFLQLLQVLDKIPGEWWSTWFSSHPNYMTDKLISFVGDSSNKLVYSSFSGHQRPYLHFALQSGSDTMLRRMNRRHTFDSFLNKVNTVKQNIPEVHLSTDMIVGFIGESDEDFQKSIEAEKVCEFDMMYISEYSARTGTAAARLPDSVSKEEKARRKDELNDVLREIARKKNQKLVNSSQKVLIDGVDRKTGFLSGRTPHNKEIRIVDINDKSLIGKFVDVKVVAAGPWALEGTIKN